MACFLLILLVGLCFAGVPAHSQGGTLFVNGIEVITIKTGGGEFTPEKRADMAAKAVQSVTVFTATYAKESGYGIVRIGDTKVLSIDAAEAKAHKATIDSLAKTVVRDLQKALDSISFVLDVKKIWMPLGGTATVGVSGPDASKAVVSQTQSGAAKAVQKDGKITLTGEAVGECTLTVSYGQRVETLLVNVMLPAAMIGTPATAYVAGRPADKELVGNAAARAVLGVIKAPLGADVQVSVVSAPALVPSQRGTARIKATIRAEGRYPIEQILDVELKNDGMLDTKSDELWYSNRPEAVRSPGRLYWGRVVEGKAARVLYHHVNETGAPMELRYQLVNTQDVPAKVAVTLGDAAPHTNPTLAGYRAGEEFFPRWVQGSAFIIEIPPHSSVPVVWERVEKGETASGLLALHGVSGTALFIGDASVSSIKRPVGNFAASMPGSDLSDSPMNLVGNSQHVYSPAEKSLKLEYVVGQRWGYIRIGQEPVGRVDGEGKLDGNFGIVYKVEATLTNPTEAEQEIEFVFESSAGYTGAFFRINGLVYRTPLLQPKTSHQFYKVKLAPGESKTYFLETMPLSGGSYPCTVTIKPVGVG